MKLDKNLLWNYIGFGISLGVNVILLPLVIKYLNKDELGLWYVFLSIGSFVTMVDFGFSPQIARFITYAYAGTDNLQKEGVIISSKREPNFILLHKLLSASHKLYLYLSFLVLILLMTIGTYYIYSISKTLPIINVFTAWFLFCIATFINILYCYYGAFYRGIGNFIDINKALLISKGIQIICTLIGLYYGFGIVAVAFAFLLSGIIFRFYLALKLNSFKRKYFLFKNSIVQGSNTLSTIWHNSWREGIVMLSRYLIIQSNTILCSLYIGLSDTAAYALAIQILTIISSISLIHFTTNLPLLNTNQVTNNTNNKYKLLSKLWVSFVISFFFLLLMLYSIGLPIIEYLKPGIMLTKPLLTFISIYIFLETNQSFFTSYISTSNKLPYVYPYLLSACLGVMLSILLLENTNLGIFGIILAHFLTQLIYNNWIWPYHVLKEFHTNIYYLFTNGIKQYYFQL